MATVLNELPVAIGQTKLLINNRWVNSRSGKTFPTINPSTGEEICQVAEADEADVNEAVKVARHAFEIEIGLSRAKASCSAEHISFRCVRCVRDDP
jgi:delta 1-pyrroline-5-carboxylate dehydrogenase